MSFWNDWDWNGAMRSCEKALQQKANYSEASHLYAAILLTLGDLENAIIEIKRAQGLFLGFFDYLLSRAIKNLILVFYTLIARVPTNSLNLITLFHKKKPYNNFKLIQGDGGEKIR